jgi:cyclic pyranopterin monophosphate synthase
MRIEPLLPPFVAPPKRLAVRAGGSYLPGDAAPEHLPHVSAMTDDPTLTHVKPHGGVQMVDVTEKSTTVRTAVAAGRVILGRAAFELVQENRVRKGDVLAVAQVAGIMGAKQTSKLIPLCHDVSVRGIDIEFTLIELEYALDIRAYAKTIGGTGVEMEALTAVSVAALTVYDMCKSVSKEIVISDIHLVAKTGGASGDYRRVENR